MRIHQGLSADLGRWSRSEGLNNFCFGQNLVELMKLAPSFVAFAVFAASLSAQELPSQAQILEPLQRVNRYFMEKWPDPGKEIVTNRARPSNIWTRGVYYEGLTAVQRIAPDAKALDYAVRWGDFHKWGLRTGTRTRNADDQCCGQTYLELYLLDPKPERMRDIKADIDFIVSGDRDNDWTWIDAIQMGMPVFARLGVITKDPKYFEKMHAMYLHTKNVEGGKGLFNPADGLWWRDKDFVAPYKEPNGEDCYWSRGNGWVVAALVRVLDILPADAPHRAEYVSMLQTMCEALRKVQRSDGFWNASLHDPNNFGGKETSGTALFTYGMAWGVRHGVLDAAVYRPVIAKAWKALATESAQPNGFLGYVQGTGKQPSEGQPTAVDKAPDFEDFGIGCFLLAGSEVWQLAGKSAVAR